MSAEGRDWSEDVAGIRAAGLERRAETVERLDGGLVLVAGRRMVDLASNDYLGLARDPRVAEAAARAARAHGAGAGAARAVAGRHPPLALLEERLAAWKGTAASIVAPSGYQAALAAVVGLVGRGDAVLVERGAHASLFDGARLAAAAGARLRVWRRGDLSTLEAALVRARRACGARGRLLVVADAVHSMDGDVLDLPSILALARRRGGVTLADDAHGTGVLGAAGRGVLEHFALDAADDLVVMGTLSKALGAQGGFVAGAAAAVALVENRGRAAFFATALAPPAAAAAGAALDVLAAEPERVERLRANAAHLRAALSEALGRAVPRDPTPTVPILVGAAAAATAAAGRLAAAGFRPAAVRPPTVPEGTARLRASALSVHSMAVLSEFAAAVSQALAAADR